MPKTRLGATDLLVSRLGLGTAEIGFAYGLGRPELPSEEEALSLLRVSAELGVTFFDTANYYGLSEERIRKSGILKNPAVVVCTKCAKFLEDGAVLDPKEMEKQIFEQVEQSLKTLGNLDVLPLLLLHGPSAAQMKEGTLLSIVEKLRVAGKIRYWGASTRGEESALSVIESGADALQVAFSIADQRMRNIFKKAQTKGVGIINRSVYLKGVFAGKESYLPESLAALKSAAASAKKIADDLGISLTELALRFTLSEPAINVSLVGTANIKNIKEAVISIEHGPLSSDIVAALRALAISVPDQVDPARWPKS